ncbi:MAG: bifunctional adenosylcobinamide kinase/adenosylcobinamide-phosphate guanylyltransferase [Bacillota bacterium]
MIALFYGGASSGKSEIAENFAVEKNLGCGGKPLIYMATMLPYSEEGKRKIVSHKRKRSGKGFEVVEQFYDIGNTPVIGGTVLFECVGNILANEMFCEGGIKKHVNEFILVGLKQLAAKCDNLVIVSNDLSDGGDAVTESTIRYITNLEIINKEIATNIADEVYCVRVGIPIVKKSAIANK